MTTKKGTRGMKDLHIIFSSDKLNPAVTVEPTSKRGQAFLKKEFGEGKVSVLKSQLAYFSANAAWHGLEWHSLTAACYAALYPHKVAVVLGSACDTTQDRGAN